MATAVPPVTVNNEPVKAPASGESLTATGSSPPPQKLVTSVPTVQALKDVFRSVPLPVTVVAVAATPESHNMPFGMTANSVAACSMEPPRISLNIMKGSMMHKLMCEVPEERRLPFVVHVLAPEQEALAGKFAFHKPGEPSQFDAVPHELDPETGVPMLSEAWSLFKCTLLRVIDAGDHSLVVADVTKTIRAQSRSPVPHAFPAIWHAGHTQEPTAVCGAAPKPLPQVECGFATVAHRLPRPAVAITTQEACAMSDAFRLLSLTPPLFSFTIKKSNATHESLAQAGAPFLLRMLGGAKGMGGSLADASCRVLEAHDVGDASLIVSEPMLLSTMAPTPADRAAGAMMAYGHRDTPNFCSASPTPPAPAAPAPAPAPPATQQPAAPTASA